MLVEVASKFSSETDTCYMCDGAVVSREHVPPLNLFPEARDVGSNYRKDLITVPSCCLHNGAKSRDDEFLMVSLAGIVGNNSIGYRHRFTKVDRAVRRTANRLLDKVVLQKKFEGVIALENNRFVEIIWGTPDVARLGSCFDHIARGLHYHHFGKRFDGNIKIFLGYLFHDDPGAKNWVRFVRDRADLDLMGKPRCGANPDIFYYQITDVDEHGLFLMRFCFYGGLHIYAVFIGTSASIPKHMGFELMKAGVKTILHLGEQQYEIN